MMVKAVEVVAATVKLRDSTAENALVVDVLVTVQGAISNSSTNSALWASLGWVDLFAVVVPRPSLHSSHVRRSCIIHVGLHLLQFFGWSFFFLLPSRFLPFFYLI